MKSPNALPVWQNVHHPRQRSRCRVLIAIPSALTPRGSRLASTSLSPAYVPGVEWIPSRLGAWLSRPRQPSRARCPKTVEKSRPHGQFFILHLTPVHMAFY